MDREAQHLMTRRAMVAAAARTFLGVSLPLAGLAGGRAWAAPASGSDRRVIYLFMAGGMSHLDTLDPKSNSEVQGPLKSIGTQIAGVRLSEHMPKLAKRLKRVALLRGMTSTQGAHGPGQYLAHTSYSPRATIRHPALGAWAVSELGTLNDNLPGNIVIGGGSDHPGAGFLDLKHSPLNIGNPAGGLPNAARLKNLTEEKFNQRLKLVSKFGAGFLRRYPNKKVQGYGEMYVDAIRLMNSTDVKAFDISLESEKVRERYGDDKFGQGCLLARRLIEHQARFVEVGFGGWDSHTDNFDSLAEKGPILDAALSALLDDLKERGLLKNTTVVLTSEFGRSPKINDRTGRDHHPAAYTSLLAGAGVRKGVVHGGSDDRGHFVKDGEVTVPDFNATIAQLLGIPIKKVVHSASRRPFTVADKGEPVSAVLS